MFLKTCLRLETFEVNLTFSVEVYILKNGQLYIDLERWYTMKYFLGILNPMYSESMNDISWNFYFRKNIFLFSNFKWKLIYNFSHIYFLIIIHLTLMIFSLWHLHAYKLIRQMNKSNSYYFKYRRLFIMFRVS